MIEHGGVRERFKRAVLKTAMSKGIVGSNPTPSAGMNTYKGVVEKGTKRAAGLGFPTVNIPLTGSDDGIYAARVMVGKQNFIAAAFADQKRKVLEAHLLDFADDLYGKEVTIKLEKKIRESQVFDTDTALHTAIASDVYFVRKYFEGEKI